MIGFLLLTNSLLAAATQTFPNSKIRSIDIFVSGPISVAGESALYATIAADNCPVTVRLKPNGNLSVFSPRNGAGCSSPLTITSHPRVNLTVRGERSRVNVENISGKVNVELRAGTIDLQRIQQTTTLRMAEGDIRASQLAGDLDVWLGRGNVSVAYAPLHAPHRANFLTGSANVTLKLPSEARLSTVHRLKFGHLLNEFGVSSNPNLRVFMKSESGNLRIVRLPVVLP